MITITLQKIKDADPCSSGWATVLKSKGGTKADYTAEFPLTDVIDSNGLDDALWCLRCLPEHNRIWRKYAVWCARQVEHLMTDQRSKDALDVADRYADGMATDAELSAAEAAAMAAARESARAAWEAAWEAARESAWEAAEAAARAAARESARAAWEAWESAREAAEAAGYAQKAKLVEVLTAGDWQ